MTGNIAAFDGVNDGIGGGIANADFGLPVTPSVSMSLNNTQVTGNFASGGGGGILNANFGGSTPPITLKNSHVTGNTIDNCEPTGSIAGCTR